ncbi:MAG: hypothetical protein U0528_18490 [Anaerolineae bacterium]
MTAATTQMNLDKALEVFDYKSNVEQQEKARAAGRLVGIGFSTYIGMRRRTLRMDRLR